MVDEKYISGVMKKIVLLTLIRKNELGPMRFQANYIFSILTLKPDDIRLYKNIKNFRYVFLIIKVYISDSASSVDMSFLQFVIRNS